MTDSAMIAKQARSMVEGMPLTGTVGVYASWLTGVADALEAQQAKIDAALAWMDAGHGRLADHPLRRILSAPTEPTEKEN